MKGGHIMINKKIEVKVFRSKTEEFDDVRGFFTDFGQWTTNYDEVKDAEDFQEGKVIFTRFTNAGKVSKSDQNFSIWSQFIEAAENALQDQIKLEADTSSDMVRALELKEIIDNADFDSELVSIKHRVSKSKWYEGNGIGNMRSRYDVKVPVAVENEALELQAIRKKHEGNDNFNFSSTSYKTITVRTADHDNF